MYVKVTAGTPVLYSLWDLKKDNPNTSFPSKMSDKALEEWSVYLCVEGEVPILKECEEVVRTNITLSNGIWVQNFSKERWPLDQAEQYTREKRNGLLSETDWMALSDSVMTEPWKAYRQNLRDITKQATFPYDIVWPSKPE